MAEVLWIVSLAVQALYLIVLGGSILRYHPSKPQKIEQKFLSVIVASHNDLTGLKKLIPSLLRQKQVAFEIIVGLDRSEDGSLEYLKQMESSNLKVVSIKETASGWDHKKYALSKAIEKASGEWLIFTDADCVPASASWLLSFQEHLSGEKTIILGISPYEKTSGLLNQYICFEAFKTAFLYAGSAASFFPYMAVGRNLAIEKAFFVDKGGYDKIKSIVGGDDDLFIQQHATTTNSSINLGSESIVYSTPSTSWRAYFRQKLRHFSVSKHYNPTSLFITVPFHISHLMFILLLPLMTLNNIFWPVVLFYLSIKQVSFRFVSKKMGFPINYMIIPIVDVMYAMLTPLIAMRSKLIKDIPWKN